MQNIIAILPRDLQTQVSDLEQQLALISPCYRVHSLHVRDNTVIVHATPALEQSPWEMEHPRPVAPASAKRYGYERALRHWLDAYELWDDSPVGSAWHRREHQRYVAFMAALQAMR